MIPAKRNDPSPPQGSLVGLFMKNSIHTKGGIVNFFSIEMWDKKRTNWFNTRDITLAIWIQSKSQ